MRRNLKAAYTIWYRDVLRFARDRVRIIAALGQPMLYLFVFGTGLAPAMSAQTGGALDFRQFMFPGILAMAVLFTAIFSAVSIVWDREFGFLKEVMVAPVSPLSLLSETISEAPGVISDAIRSTVSCGMTMRSSAALALGSGSGAGSTALMGFSLRGLRVASATLSAGTGL